MKKKITVNKYRNFQEYSNSINKVWIKKNVDTHMANYLFYNTFNTDFKRENILAMSQVHN